MIRDRMPTRSEPLDLVDGCDILVVILRRVIALAPTFDPEVADQIEAEIRATYGGQRVRIPKRGKHLSPEERQAVYEDALTNAPTPELLRKHKISLATLKRLVKKGP